MAVKAGFSSAERQAGTVMRVMMSRCRIRSRSGHAVTEQGRAAGAPKCTRWARRVQRPGL